jgi:limonene-1,2-epoxide hydrolase
MFSAESVPSIEADCIKVTLRFFRCLDTRAHEAAADMFAPDGVWNRPGGAALTGKSEILAALEMRPSDRSTAHLLSNVWAEAVDPDHARVHFYLTLRERIATHNEPVVFKTGGVLYGTDHYVRLAQGWRIQTKGTQRVLAAAETEKQS